MDTCSCANCRMRSKFEKSYKKLMDKRPRPSKFQQEVINRFRTTDQKLFPCLVRDDVQELDWQDLLDYSDIQEVV